MKMTIIINSENWLDYIPEKRKKYEEVLKNLAPEIEKAFDKFIDVEDIDGSEKISNWLENNIDLLPLEKILQRVKEKWRVYLEINRTKKDNTKDWTQTVWHLLPEEKEFLENSLLYKTNKIEQWDILTFLCFQKDDENNYKVSLKKVQRPIQSSLINKEIWLVYVSDGDNIDINTIKIAS